MSRVILISGKQGSGKTTTADALLPALRSAGLAPMRHRFASAVYLAHDAVYAVLKPLGILQENKKDGKLLQVIGTEWGRSIDKDIWVKHVQKFVTGLEDKFKCHPQVKVTIIVDDTRFENEFDAFPDALSVRLECPKEDRKPRTNCWREDDEHPSETGLDGYSALDKFNLYFDTSVVPLEQVVSEIAQEAKKRWEDS